LSLANLCEVKDLEEQVDITIIYGLAKDGQELVASKGKNFLINSPIFKEVDNTNPASKILPNSQWVSAAL